MIHISTNLAYVSKQIANKLQKFVIAKLNYDT